MNIETDQKRRTVLAALFNHIEMLRELKFGYGKNFDRDGAHKAVQAGANLMWRVFRDDVIEASGRIELEMDKAVHLFGGVSGLPFLKIALGAIRDYDIRRGTLEYLKPLNPPKVWLGDHDGFFAFGVCIRVWPSYMLDSQVIPPEVEVEVEANQTAMGDLRDALIYGRQENMRKIIQRARLTAYADQGLKGGTLKRAWDDLLRSAEVHPDGRQCKQIEISMRRRFFAPTIDFEEIRKTMFLCVDLVNELNRGVITSLRVKKGVYGNVLPFSPSARNSQPAKD